MVVIWGNSTLMARAAQMVLTCNRSSDATPADNGNWNCWAVAGAPATNDSTSAGLAVCGPLVGGDTENGGRADADPGLGGFTGGFTAGAATQHRGSVLWAWIIAAETTSEAGIAHQRPRPLANTFQRTDSSLMRFATPVAIFLRFLCAGVAPVDADAGLPSRLRGSSRARVLPNRRPWAHGVGTPPRCCQRRAAGECLGRRRGGIRAGRA
jgi:hypothetical protein